MGKMGSASRQPGPLAWVIAAALAAAVGPYALAQGWKPEKPVEIIIGTSPGGPQDRTGRLIQRILQEQKLAPGPVNVVNKPGGGGAIGLNYLNQRPGDGHYLMINATTLLTNHITGKNALGPGDFTPLAIMGSEYVGVTVRADSPLKSGRELIEQLRKDPGSLSVAIGTALGNATHISFALAMRAGGIDIRKLKTVVFSSGGESLTALLGGHIDVAASAPSTQLQHIKAGKLRMLAIGAPQRLPGDLAGVPTWRELGVESTFGIWRGLAGPRGMPAAQVQFWDDALAKVVQAEEWKNELDRYQMANLYKNSAETGKHWKAEYEEAKGVLTELGLAR